jgi:hypothetical protein
MKAKRWLWIRPYASHEPTWPEARRLTADGFLTRWLTQGCHVSATDAKYVIKAVEVSRSPAARDLWQRVQPGLAMGALRPRIHDAWSPGRVIAMLEGLVQEGHLHASVAHRVKEHILGETPREGEER